MIAVILSAKTEDLQSLVSPSLEALRSCVSLLRRFSGRYVCGLRNADLLEEFCRCEFLVYSFGFAFIIYILLIIVNQIPLDAPPSGHESPQFRPPWLRPVKKRNRTPSAPCSTESTDAHEGHDFLDMPAATSHSSPSQSHSSHEDTFLPVAADVDMGLHYHSISHLPHILRTPELPSQMLRSDMSPGGISPTDLTALLNESNFDVSTLFPLSGSMDIFPNSPHLHGNERELGIIASP